MVYLLKQTVVQTGEKKKKPKQTNFGQHTQKKTEITIKRNEI
jgi:hypothetical protein